MSEEIKKQETMDDFAQEIEASFSNFRDADMEIWDKLEIGRASCRERVSSPV